MPGFHVRNNLSRSCIVAVISWRGHPYLRVACKCELLILNVVIERMFCPKRRLERRYQRVEVLVPVDVD